jgi:hypothetical protein
MTTRILSSLRRAELAAQHARNVDLTIGDTTGEEAATIDKENPTMGNEKHARGVPIIGRGINGAIPGTTPGFCPEFDNGHRHGQQSNLGRIP